MISEVFKRIVRIALYSYPAIKGTDLFYSFFGFPQLLHILLAFGFSFKLHQQIVGINGHNPNFNCPKSNLNSKYAGGGHAAFPDSQNDYRAAPHNGPNDRNKKKPEGGLSFQPEEQTTVKDRRRAGGYSEHRRRWKPVTEQKAENWVNNHSVNNNEQACQRGEIPSIPERQVGPDLSGLEKKEALEDKECPEGEGRFVDPAEIIHVIGGPI
jgi:hypothetical protein